MLALDFSDAGVAVVIREPALLLIATILVVGVVGFCVVVVIESHPLHVLAH